MTSNAPRPEAPRIAVFAKAPRAGAVKTRLVPLLGAQGAASLHAALVRHALSTATRAQPDSLQLWCAPDTADPFFSECAARFSCELRMQRGHDLGARMAHAFAAQAPLLLIGTDCPPLRASHLSHAWRLLVSHDVAIAPAEDGGYVMIGLARPAPALFERIEWGTDTVLAETRRRIAAAGLKSIELETLWDVDRPEDYRRLQQTGLAREVEA
ncbi:MAG: TIGR04282 family arsenosugar biosynthesis glycosyltransferase [Burkholderiales bacterium]|nr:TIGR04282 family arsenosugar biosynthesis glycosyltransferase [Burkholderiales bacterium]